MASVEHRYDSACTRVFEFTHDMVEGSLSRVITNPNEYFDLSREIHEGKRTKETQETTELIVSSQMI
jgi:hypothetical protein